MSIINANKINKYFGVEQILTDISFIVNKGDRIGIVGPNGAGKSTLIKILAGEYTADDGDLYIDPSLTVGYLQQRDHFPGGGTILEEMEKALNDKQKAEFEEKRGYSYESGVRGMLKSLAFAEDSCSKSVALLSGGEKTRLALAVLLLQQPDILLLDEPTNHLDIGMLKWLEKYLKGYGGTFLVISHDRYFLDETVTRIFEIEGSRFKAYKGNYTEYKEKKQISYEEDLKHYEQAMAEIARQEEIIRRFKEHNTEHLVKRAQSREKRLAQQQMPVRPVNYREKLNIRFTAELNSGNDVILAYGLSKSFGSRKLFSGVDLDIKKGEKVCIVGPNGVGKTTLLKIILGQLAPDTGHVQLGQNVTPGYYDQEQKLLDPSNTVLGEIHNEYIKYDQTDLRKLLGRFMFYGDDVFKRVKDLAGGEKAKLSLLKLMMGGANLLIMDEPTNHLDIRAKEVFEEALIEYPGTLVIVSHDRYLLSRVATSIYELDQNGITVYKGGYDYYTEKSASIRAGVTRLDAPEKKDLSKEERMAQRQREKEAALAERKRAKQLENAETLVQQLEAEAAEYERLMCRPDIFSNPAKAQEMNGKLAEVRKKLDEAYEQWMLLQG